MKRLLCILLILALCLPGCALKKNRMQEPVTFYYLHKHETEDQYDTFFTSGAIGSEMREAANHRDNLPYLLALYLLGPTSEELDLPFPTGTKLQKIHMENKSLTLTIRTVSTLQNDMELTIACACLAKTSMELVDVDTVTIEFLDSDAHFLFTRTFNANNLVLEDSYIPTEQPQ